MRSRLITPKNGDREAVRESAVPKLVGAKSDGIRTNRWIGRAGQRRGTASPRSSIIDSGKTVANLRRDDYVDSRDICFRNWNRISIVSNLVGDRARREGRSLCV